MAVPSQKSTGKPTEGGGDWTLNNFPGDDTKLDVMLMRSASGDRIVDIDFSMGQPNKSQAPDQPQQIAQSQALTPAQPSQPMGIEMSQPGHMAAVSSVMPMRAFPASMPFPNAPQMQFGNAQMQHAMQHPGMQPQPQAMPTSGGRKLKILEHRVHRVDHHAKENGGQEEELVVSNLRHFTLKVGVHGMNEQPIADSVLPLQATLLYENGLPVKQMSTSEPLLVGETDVVALQGTATFKLRITSLSSHRDKQRFRIQVTPQDPNIRLAEPALSVVTLPMKSVTKLGNRVPGQSKEEKKEEKKEEAVAAVAPEEDDSSKRYCERLDNHASQISQLQESQKLILQELKSMSEMMMMHAGHLNKKQRVDPPNNVPSTISCEGAVKVTEEEGEESAEKSEGNNGLSVD